MKRSCLVTLITLVLVLLLSACTSNSNDLRHSAIFAMKTEKAAYIPTMDGNCITIEGEINEAAITPNQKKVVVSKGDSEVLYITNKEQTEEKELAKQAYLSNIKDNGIIYIVGREDGMKFTARRYMFSNGSNVSLGEVSDREFPHIVTQNLRVYYACSDGNIYLLEPESDTPEKISSYSGDVSFLDVSENGDSVIWETSEESKTESDKKIYNAYFYADGKCTMLDEYENLQSDSSATFSKGDNLLVVSNHGSDNIYLKEKNSDFVKAKLNREASYTSFYSENDYLHNDDSSEIQGVYFSLESDKDEDLDDIYWVNLNGEREKVISSIKEFAIFNKYIYYIDSDNNLFYASVDKGNMEEAYKISGEVDTFDCADGYIYYLKFSRDNKGDLYVYHSGENNPEKIAEGVGCFTSQNYTTVTLVLSDLSFLDNGKTVVYYTDLNEIKGTYKDEGTMMMYTYGDADSVKISSEVVKNSINSRLESGKDIKNSFIYEKYVSVNSESSEDYVFDLMYYNGKESVTLAKNLNSKDN